MQIHPWDAADDDEWRSLLLSGHDFGQLIAAGRDRDVPVVVPTHFVFDGDRTAWLHLTRPNPVWRAIDENPAVLLAVVADYTFVPGTWKPDEGEDPSTGIPTSYYASVQLVCTASVVEEPDAMCEILKRSIARFDPDAHYAPIDPADARTAALLRRIRGLELDVVDVRAKFKYGGNTSPQRRLRVAERLAERGWPSDAPAREHLLRRLDR
jgi:transcriptional regulator